MRPVFIWANGTSVPDPWGPGFGADIARALSDPWNDVMAQFWGGTGNAFDVRGIWYDAAVFPMGRSVQQCRARINAAIAATPRGTPLVLCGYSQSAIAVGIVWRDDILNPAGVHDDRLGDVLAIILFGDPLRCPGIANGNRIAGLPMPTKLFGNTTGGIAGPGCLTPEQTPDFMLSCALDGDLYAAAPIGDDPWRNESMVGQIETAVYDFVQSGNAWDDGLMVILERIAYTFAHPIESVVAHAEAIYNALVFFAAGTNAPHWRYGPFVPAMVDWLGQRARTLTAA